MTEKEESAKIVVNASRIFTGYRALGLVSNHIPLVTRYISKRKETLICTVIGNSFHTYRVSLTYLFSSLFLPENNFIAISQENSAFSKLAELMKMTLHVFPETRFMCLRQVGKQSKHGKELLSSRKSIVVMKNQFT